MVSYRFQHYKYEGQEDRTSVEITGTTENVEVLPDYANLRICDGLGSIGRRAKGSQVVGGAALVLSDENWDYYYSGPQAACSPIASEQEQELRIAQLLRDALTNPDNFSPIQSGNIVDTDSSAISDTIERTLRADEIKESANAGTLRAVILNDGSLVFVNGNNIVLAQSAEHDIIRFVSCDAAFDIKCSVEISSSNTSGITRTRSYGYTISTGELTTGADMCGASRCDS